jgi:hypothetical protein
VAAPPRSPPPGPSGTFVLDIPVATAEDVLDDFASLRLRHEEHVEGLLGGDELGSGNGSGDGNGLSNGKRVDEVASLASRTTTLTSASHSATSDAGGAFPRNTAAHYVQPKFNLDSATSLLASFRQSMLPLFPCITLPPHATVSFLAQDRPFLLLAILSAASGCRSLQGHSLYDGEFRRVLGLKSVASGEVSLEILQGLLVYIAW